MQRKITNLDKNTTLRSTKITWRWHPSITTLLLTITLKLFSLFISFRLRLNQLQRKNNFDASFLDKVCYNWIKFLFDCWQLGNNIIFFMITITLSIKELDKTSIKYISWISLYNFNMPILIICFWLRDNLFIHI
jgi:hypothetical protein